MDGDKCRAVLFKPRAVHAQPVRIGIQTQGAVAGVDVHLIRHGGSRSPQRHQLAQHRVGQDRADGFHQNANCPAAGQPDGKGIIVTDAKFQQARLAVFHGLLRLDDHRAFDAAARHRSLDPAVLCDGKLATDAARGAAPCLNHRGKRNRFAILAPAQGRFRAVVESVHCALPQRLFKHKAVRHN